MSSQVAVRVAPQLPQILCVPPDVASLATADDTIELATAYELVDGAPLSESQQLRLRNGMAERADHRWAAKRVGDFGGRQGAGKTGVVITRIFGGLLIVGERLIIYTAHEFPTANEVFLRVGVVLEAWDDLSRLVLAEKRAHGDQGFELKGPKGSELTERRRLLFKTRTGKSGRGFSKADLIIYDEAQHLQRSQVAGSGPAKLANPNSQSWWSGSGGFETSGPAWEMRRQAILGTGGRLAYAEHTAETFTVVDGRVTFTAPDFTNRDDWYRANPGLGDWVTEEDFADLVLELGELAPQELGCIWEPELGTDEQQIITLARWAELVDERSSIVGDVSTAIDVSPDLKWATIASAGLRADSHIHVEVGRRQPGTDWIVQFAKDNPQHGPYRVAGAGPAGFLLPLLAAEDVETVDVPAGDVTQACTRLIAAVEAGTIHHLGSNEIAAALSNATITNRGDVRVWSRVKSSGDISALVAATIAVGGVSTDDAEPRIWF